jgi:hypothetical protein
LSKMASFTFTKILKNFLTEHWYTDMNWKLTIHTKWKNFEKHFCGLKSPMLQLLLVDFRIKLRHSPKLNFLAAIKSKWQILAKTTTANYICGSKTKMLKHSFCSSNSMFLKMT